MAATQCIYAHRHGQGDFPKIKLSIKMGKKLVYFGVMNEKRNKDCFLVVLEPLEGV